MDTCPICTREAKAGYRNPNNGERCVHPCHDRYQQDGGKAARKVRKAILAKSQCSDAAVAWLRSLPAVQDLERALDVLENRN